MKSSNKRRLAENFSAASPVPKFQQLQALGTYTMDSRIPETLKILISERRWSPPDVETMIELFPEMEHPITFLDTDELMLEHHGLMYEDEIKSEIFREYRSSKIVLNYGLPWLDLDNATFIISNTPMYDSAIALDYRGCKSEPIVVYSKWNATKSQCNWVKITENFTDFCNLLKIKI